MRISKKWLHEYVFLPDSLTPKEFMEQLTLHTVEVDGYVDQQQAFEHMVVVRIEDIQQHPNANALQVCIVFDGQERYTIVCGGSNLTVGMLVALGKVGAKVRWHGEGELIELQETAIRGVVSQGMICAANEIGLGQLYPQAGEKEILDLSHLKVKPGMPLAEALGMTDVLFDIDNKSMNHRPDLWGHYGMAREVAAVYGKKLTPYEPRSITEGKGTGITVHIEEPELCSRYMAVAVSHVVVAPSPAWLQERLRAVGLTPINNVVDITNYVMFDCGQPLHAFDAEKIQSKKGGIDIRVRKAKEEETLITLDGKQRLLRPADLIIANKERPLALAGIIGGMDSAIDTNSTTIMFEAATFHAVSVRRSAMAFGVRTESSARFEKTLDPYLPEIALRKAVELLQQVCPSATVCSTVVDKGFKKKTVPTLRISYAYLAKKIGQDIAHKQIITILERLGFGVVEKKNEMLIQIPSWRTKDITQREDIVEEVARMYGYDHITATLPLFPVVAPEQHPVRSLEHRVEDTLAMECAYSEVYNYSFVSPVWLEQLGMSLDGHLRLQNPMQQDRPLLRRSLLPNLLKSAEQNAHKESRVALFEIGKTFLQEEAGDRPGDDGELLPRQQSMLGIIYMNKGEDTPFFGAKAALTTLANRLGSTLEYTRLDAGSRSYIHAGRAATLSINGRNIGEIYELHPRTLQSVGISLRLCYAEVSLTELSECIVSDTHHYTALPVFPSIMRDIAFVVDKLVTHQELMIALQQVNPLIVSVTLFDVYEGEHVQQGKKSMAYSIVYQSKEKTLTTQDIDVIHTSLRSMLEKHFSAQLR